MESLNGLDIIINARDNVTQILSGIQSKIGEMGETGQAQFARIDQAAAALQNRVRLLYAAVGTFLAGFASSKMVGVPAQFESITAQLTTVTKSSQAAKEATKWVTDFAAKTPYALGQVSEAYAKLLSYGFDPKPILETIGNAASGMQKGLDQAVEAYADATRGEFERLKEFGINASTVGNQVTLSWMQNGQQMEKTVTKNAENIGAALSGIWADMFQGGMSSQMETWKGRLSNFLDGLTRGIQRFMSGGLFDAIKEKLAGITGAVEKLEQSGKLEEWGKAATAAFNAVWNAGQRLVTFVVDFVSRYRDLLESVAIVAGFSAAVFAFGSLVKSIAAAAKILHVFKAALAASEVSLAATTGAMLKGVAAWAALIMLIPDAIKGYKNAALALNEWLNPLSKTNQLNKQAASYQKLASENTAKADANIRKYAKSLGYTVTGLDDFRKSVSDGTIKLKDHAGNVALTSEEYKKLQSSIKKAQTAGSAYITQVAERYDQQAKEAKKLAATEGAAAADGLAAQRDKYKAVLAVAQAVYQQQIAYINSAAGTESQKAALRADVEKNLQAAKTSALKDWLSALKSGLDEALSQEKRYAQESENATKTTEEKIRALKRQTMSASSAYYDEVSEANEKLAKAQQAAASGTAEGMDKAMTLSKEAQSAFVSAASAGKDVVGNSSAVQTAIEGVAKAGQVWADAADAGKAAWANTVEVFKNQIADAKAALEDLKNNPVTAKVSCDTTAVDQALDALRSTETTSHHRVDPNTTNALKAIAELKKDTWSTHTVYIQEVTQKSAGGPVRDVPVMAMPGEVVVEPERAGRLGPLLNAINTLRLPVDAILHRASGGGVFRPFLSGLIPGSGDEDSEPLLLRQGSFVVRKSAVQRYGADFINALGHGIPVPRFATGGLVLPDWLRRLTGRPEPTTTSAAPAASPVVVASEASAPLQALEKPLAGRRKMSSTGSAALGRLNALRGKGLTAFSSGGDLDETLADIALERKRTQEDYESDIADAQTDHDDQLAGLLKQEQSDLDDIAQTLADTLADLQKTWKAAQKAYAKDMAEAKSALQKAEREWYEWTYNADISYSANNNEGDTVLYSQKQVDNNYSSKAKGGFVNALRDLQHFAAGGVSRWYKWTYSDGYMMPAKSRLVHFIDYSETAKEKNASLDEAIESAQEKINEVQETYNEAQGTYSSGVAEARGTAQDDTSSTKSQFQDDASDLDAELADKLEDLKTAYDRTMEDLDIKEARARADAEEEGDYEISGFSSWLADGGPVKALGRIRRFAEGGLVRLLHRLPRFADGGTVPLVEGAERGVDSVIAALTPGEGVINLKAMGQVISKRALAALNNLDLDGFLGELPRFAAGGVVGAGRAAAGLTPTNAAATDGYSATLNLNLGGRTYETRTSRATAAELARELRRQGVNVKS